MVAFLQWRVHTVLSAISYPRVFGLSAPVHPVVRLTRHQKNGTIVRPDIGMGIFVRSTIVKEIL